MRLQEIIRRDLVCIKKRKTNLELEISMVSGDALNEAFDHEEGAVEGFGDKSMSSDIRVFTFFRSSNLQSNCRHLQHDHKS